MRWEIKYLLIAYFLGNTCAKNCRNRAVYVKIIATQSGTFFETWCIMILGHRLVAISINDTDLLIKHHQIKDWSELLELKVKF